MSGKNGMPNQVVRSDIPATDLDRAMKFHGAVPGARMERQSFQGMPSGPVSRANP